MLELKVKQHTLVIPLTNSITWGLRNTRIVWNHSSCDGLSSQIQEGSSDITIENTDSSSQLTIASGQQEHCGCYTVEIRNNYAMRQAALNLTIVGKTQHHRYFLKHNLQSLISL